MQYRSVIFVRRDNIGDLLCTTPAIKAVKERYPCAQVGILVNSYNADVIKGNPYIDEVYVYRKTKHVKENPILVWAANLRVLWQIRKGNYDVAIGCGSYSPRLARYTFITGAKVRIGYCKGKAKNFFYNKPIIEPSEKDHEVINTFNLLKPFGIDNEPGELILKPDHLEQNRFKVFKADNIQDRNKPLLAITISARIKKNKWPIEKFMTLIKRILNENIANVLLLWAPGSKYNSTFPGDDESADLIVSLFKAQIMAYSTPTLKSLIAALSLSDMVVTLDTGSLHMSAALKKPTIALMTKWKAPHWYPWKIKSIVLTSEGPVETLSVDTVLNAINTMISELYKRDINKVSV